MNKGQQVIIIDEDSSDPAITANNLTRPNMVNHMSFIKQDYIPMPMYPYFGMPFVPIDPMQFNPYAMNMFPMANMLQKPIIPVIQKKLTEEEKIIEDAVANFYQKYSSTHKICECDSCEKLALPFMVKWDLNDEERIEIEKSHKEYLDELLTKNEAYRYDTSRKINNLFSKQVYLGELKFKLKEE